MTTRRAKIRYAAPALADITEALLRIDKALGFSPLGSVLAIS
ncbi:hypothetical protein [Kitasatospora sp. NPDC001175]